jgi:uncharacterized iron-regulated membrane protein
VTYWERWIRQPQTAWLRKATFQVHLWSAIAVGLYVLMVSVTGSILVYRNELAMAAIHSPAGIRLVSKLLELHDDLLGGETGRRINGVGAILVIVLACTGIVVWWPGIRTWRRSLTVRRHVGWQRFTWDVHSMIGFWTFGFILLFGLSGAYLGNPQPFQDLADRLQPPTDVNEGTRLVDQGLYWLAYLHFGRINGIGIPCRGPGLCDQMTKLTWAVFGLAPAVMLVTGVMMWWNRVVRKKLNSAKHGRRDHLNL